MNKISMDYDFNSDKNQNRRQSKTKISTLMLNSKAVLEASQKLKSSHLITIEEDEQKEKKLEKTAKKIQSYVKNRDTLYIEAPERVKNPINIEKNIIEFKKEIPVCDIAIQSDDIDYKDKSKPFLQQKIGKDTATQIEDGDLFCFDRDVEPIVSVIINKTLEQTLLELSEEEEWRKINEARVQYRKNLKDERERRAKLEKEEAEKKDKNDTVKKIKKEEKKNRTNAQKKVVSRIFSKNYLSGLKVNVMGLLERRGMFSRFTVEAMKDKIRNSLFQNAEMEEFEDLNFDLALDGFENSGLKEIEIEHTLKLKNHREEMEKIRLENEEIKRKEEEEKARIERETAERRRLRQIRKLKENIRRTIFETPDVKGELYNEEISEIDNFDQESKYIGILGGVIGSFILSINFIKNNCFKQDNLYTFETIYEMMLNYLSFSGKVTIPINFGAIEEEVLKIEPTFDLKNFASLSLEPNQWKDISNIISEISICSDPFLLDLVREASLDISLYSNIVKSLVKMLENVKESDKINFVSVPLVSTEEKLAKFNQICILKMEGNSLDILESTDYQKDRKKKNIKVPEFGSLNKTGKLYSKTEEFKILIYDKFSEFLVRNKIFDNCLKTLAIRNDFNDLETKTFYLRFNEYYDEVVSKFEFENKIQVFDFILPDQSI